MPLNGGKRGWRIEGMSTITTPFGFYVPLSQKDVQKIVETQGAPSLNGGHWLRPTIRSSERLKAAFAELDPTTTRRVQAHLALVANMVLSADRIELWDEEEQSQSLRRVRACLCLGLDQINGPDASAEVDAQSLAQLGFSHRFSPRLWAFARRREALQGLGPKTAF